MKSLKIAVSVSLLACFFLHQAPAPAANDLASMVRLLAGVVRSYDDLDLRRAQTENAINSALSAGQISSDDAAALRSDLNDIAQREKELKDSGKKFGFMQQLYFTNQMTVIANRLNQAATAKAGLPGGAVITPESLEKRQQELKSKIDSLLGSGKLHQTDADKLNQDLKHFSDLKTAFLSTSNDGKLSVKQLDLLNLELEKTGVKIDEQVKMSDSALPQLNERRSGLHSKINEAEAANKLTKDLSSQLRSELNEVEKLQSGFLADSNLSGSEILKVADELDRMQLRIERAVQTTAAAVAPPPAPPANTGAPPTAATAPDSSASSSHYPATVAAPAYNSDKYTDIKNYWGAPYVAILGERGVIGGFPDGSFKPENPITRSQFAAIAVRALGLPAASGSANFNDVPAKHWANAAIAAVSASGLVTGFPDGSFKPEDKITRTQALVILAKSLPAAQSDKAALNAYSDASLVPAWAYASVLKAADAGIIVNYPDTQSIRPQDFASRGETAALIYRTLQNLGQDLPPVQIGLAPHLLSKLPAQSMPPTAPAHSGNLPHTSVQTPPQQTTATTSSASKLYVFEIKVNMPEKIHAGDLLTVSAIASPKSQARLTIEGALESSEMKEIRDGVYEASYTVRRSDNIAAAKVKVTLSREGLSPASLEYAKTLNLDVKAPEISDLQPADNALLSDRNSSIVVKFNDGQGAGVDPASVKLLINGQDESSLATVSESFLTYKPRRLFRTDLVNVDLSFADKAGNIANKKWTFRFDKPFVETQPFGGPGRRF